jgi:hypothetical protein
MALYDKKEKSFLFRLNFRYFQNQKKKIVKTNELLATKQKK